MKKNKNTISGNFLDKVPAKNPDLKWTLGEDGAVVLELENKGFMNRIAQKLLKKPKVSYIHLDETGNFVWPLIDGKTDITQIGVEVKEHFGEAAEPLYERLTQYFKTLETYGFIELK